MRLVDFFLQEVVQGCPDPGNRGWLADLRPGRRHGCPQNIRAEFELQRDGKLTAEVKPDVLLGFLAVSPWLICASPSDENQKDADSAFDHAQADDRRADGFGARGEPNRGFLDQIQGQPPCTEAMANSPPVPIP